MRRLHACLLVSVLAHTHFVSAQSATQASSQPARETGPVAGTGEVEVGGRFTTGFDDFGRYNTFADPRSGVTVDRLRYARNTGPWLVEAAVDHAGYRDQRYATSFEKAGRIKAVFEWNQIPLWYSRVSTTPFTVLQPGVFGLNDAAQTAVQRGATVANVFGGLLAPFDTRSRRDIATASLVYSARRDLDLSLLFRSTSKTGEMPFAASFGFSNAIELPVTIDTRTNDITTAAEWSSPRGMVRVAYDGSFFANAVDTVIWDNPLRITDQTHPNAYSTGDGSSQGRLALWPDSSAHTVSASGSLNLPGRSRGTAYVSLGSWLQDAELLPHTINTAIQPIPLARDSAEAEARIVSMFYRVTSRPTSRLWINAQYRLYDYDNRTPHFPVSQYVRLDGNIGTSVTGGSEPFELSRNFVDVDLSYTPLRFVAFRAGWGLEHDDRSYRYVETTNENVARFSVDSTNFSWGSARLLYEFSNRTGEGLDEQVLSDIGEQVSLRQFDISDRIRHRVSGIVQATPWSAVGLSGSVSIGQEHRPDTAFGLQDNDLVGFSVGADVTPRDGVGLAISYGFENISTLQRSRQANPGPQFDDPTRDWTTDMDEDVHTWTANLDIPRLTARTALFVVYDFVRSDTQYLYGLAPNSALAVPEQLPLLTSDFHRASATLEYGLTDRVTLGVGYALDKWRVSDFSRSDETLDTALIPALVNTLYRWAPYDVNAAFVRVRYRW
jgi:MtrB/PioB family decaheme-associated outer membrane protein